MSIATNTDAIRSNLKLIGAAALPIYWRQSLQEMADEIDRLRAELADCKRGYDGR